MARPPPPTWLPGTTAALLVLHLLAGLLGGAETAIALSVDGRPGDTVQHWATDEVLEIRWSAAGPVEGWLDCLLQTADDRHFVSAASQRLAGRSGSWTLPLQPGSWAGEHGPLDDDALAAVRRVALRFQGDGAAPAITASATRRATTRPATVLRLDAAPLFRRGPWYELHFELLGRQPEADDLVLLELPGHGPVPCFRHQPGRIVGGRWWPEGSARWVARLRPEERPEGEWRIRIDGAAAWSSPRFARPLQAATGLAVPPPPTAQPPLQAAGGRRTTVYHADLEPQLMVTRIPGSGQEPTLRLAPQLVWQADWTGYRGGAACAHAVAAGLDGLLLAGCPAIDLLPQRLFEEQDAWRFGLAPWHASSGGPWRHRAEAFAYDGPLRDLARQARELVARCRAAPRLAHWAMSAQASANDATQYGRLQHLVEELAAFIARCDGRPLHVDHPQLRPWRKRDTEPWFDFERSNEGWYLTDRLDAGPLRPWANITESQASEGRRSLHLPLPVSDRDQVCWVATNCPIDHNFFALERLEFDVLLTGCGMATIMLHVTDERHRWYQREVAVVQAGRHWQTVGVDFDEQADWQAVGHAIPWDGSQRRRLRELGIAVWHWRPVAEHARRSELFLDRMVRAGWPRSPDPHLLVRVESADTSATVHRPFGASFSLNLPSRNPYDPDEADLTVELQAPDGHRYEQPAWWQEDWRLADGDDDGENASLVPTGRAAWHFRFAPRQAGTWRWRLQARIKHQDRWLESTGDWQDVQVAAAHADQLVPIRQSADPRYWETLDGDFFYPVGINLRSPGDERQDDLLRNAGSRLRSRDWERRGLAAYVDWFDDMATHHMNYARIWMCPWWCGLEWTREWDGFGGLGDFNQENAARLDHLVALAAARGIYLQIELQNHGMTSPHIDHQWELSPYRRDGKGHGLVDDASEFFGSEACWEQLAKRHRYVVARWGAEPHIMAWVLSSEMEFTGSWYRNAYDTGFGDQRATDPVTQAWIDRNLAWFREHDHSGRPVSIHFSHPWRAATVWRDNRLGFNNSNVYSGFQTAMGRLGGHDAGLGSAFGIYLDEHFPPWQLGRPTMVGEWGGHWAETDPIKLDAELRVGLWLQTVLPYGGNVGFWWWLWIDAADRWPAYDAIATFMRDEDPRGDARLPHRPAIVGGAGNAWIYGSEGRTGQRYYAWLRGLDRRLDRVDARDAGRFVVPGGAPGSVWRVQRCDAGSGEVVLETRMRSAADGTLTVPLGSLEPDAVFRLDLLEPGDGAEGATPEEATPVPTRGR